MERQLGERFTYRGGVTLEVAEVEDEEMACKGCYLFEKNSAAWKTPTCNVPTTCGVTTPM